LKSKRKWPSLGLGRPRSERGWSRYLSPDCHRDVLNPIARP
jgi:hypothetical protein